MFDGVEAVKASPLKNVAWMSFATACRGSGDGGSGADKEGERDARDCCTHRMFSE